MHSTWRRGVCLPEIAKARLITKPIIAAIIRGLRAGKSPKEIMAMTGSSYEYIRLLMYRYPEVHKVFLETYRLRHPDKEDLPPRYKTSLREV